MIQTAAFPHDVPWDDSKALVTTGDAFEAMVRQLSEARIRVFDHETSGLAWWQHSESCGLALACHDSGTSTGWRCWYVPYRHRTGEVQLELSRIAPTFAHLFAEPHVTWIAHNFRFDEHMNRREGWYINGSRYDTLTAARLYNENISLELKRRAQSDR